MGAKKTAGIVVGGLALVAAVGAVGVIGVTAIISSISFEAPSLGDGAADRVPQETSATPVAAPDDDAWITAVADETGIPERALVAYVAADAYARAELDCEVGWNTLAGIGWVESHHGTLPGASIDADGVARPEIRGIPLDGTNDTMEVADTDNGELDGDPTWDRAVGPMQFIPETWSIWAVDGSGNGAPNPHNIDDAAATAARYLCRLDGTLGSEEAWVRAVRSYNDTFDYQVRVASAAERYANDAVSMTNR